MPAQPLVGARAQRLEPAPDELELPLRDDIRAGAEVDDVRARRVEPDLLGECLAVARRPQRKPGVEDMRPRRPHPLARDAVQLDGVAHLCVVPDEDPLGRVLQ